MIPIVAKSIEFTKHAIVYQTELVLPEEGQQLQKILGFHTTNDIAYKDLIPKTTSYNVVDGRVMFVPSNVTTAFYQALLDKEMHNQDEFEVELAQIYLPGDIVGFAIIH